MKSKRKKPRRWVIVCISILFLIAIFLLLQWVQCRIEVRNAYERLDTYDAQVATLSYGEMTYVDRGKGEPILVAHGISGGYDQGYDAVKNAADPLRIIAPSRFGYLGSEVPINPTPKEQAKAYAELLDMLGIEKTYILGTSAGGSIAIRFALDYPERTKGLILYSSAAPSVEKPSSYMEYAGPPELMCNDYAMWLLRPLFKPLMGMEADTIYGMMPVSDRREGMVIDASITNPDMARNYEDYPIEQLQVPSLIIHAQDDKLASYENMEQAVPRFPNCTFVSIQDGGHLMSGHGEEVEAALLQFMMGPSVR